ncbi:hypothetical protein ABE424_07090 [Stenotrophomonas sp. TWI1149]|uniref:hypothetical protein n=1 Tax=unclassified Stenotrophomonas TaxID=196198 RepID=UPI00320B2503
MTAIRLPLTALALVLGVAACQPAGAPTSTEPQAAATVPGTAGGASPFSEAAIWDGEVDACRGQAPVADDCLARAMQAAKASPQAIAAAHQLGAQGNPGYVSAWREQDGVGIATIEYPFRANTNESTLLVDSAGHTVDVDADVLPEMSRADATVKPFLDAHPEATPFAPAEASGSEARPDGGVRLIYSTPMRTCHACADVGKLRVAYDFDAQRRFSGKQILELR